MESLIMDKQEFDKLKERIHTTRERIISMFTDMNGATPMLIAKLKLDINIFEADLIEYGGYLENECTKETLEKTQVAIAKKHLDILNKQSNDMDVGAEIRNKSFEMQKRNAEIQEELIQSQRESVVRQTERDKIAFETDQKMMTALESIAYSLAKLTVNSNNFDKNFKYMTPQKLDEFDIKKGIGDTEYRDKIGD